MNSLLKPTIAKVLLTLVLFLPSFLTGAFVVGLLVNFFAPGHDIFGFTFPMLNYCEQPLKEFGSHCVTQNEMRLNRLIVGVILLLSIAASYLASCLVLSLFKHLFHRGARVE